MEPNITRIISEEMDELENQASSNNNSSKSVQSTPEKIKAIDLHVFGDASITGTAAAIYAVIYQPDQGRLSKKDLTILRLESVAMHMAAKLSQNVKLALEGKPF